MLAMFLAANLTLLAQVASSPESPSKEIVLLHFQVRDRQGREIANSERRGLPYRVQIGDPSDFLARAIQGLAAGEERTVQLDAEAIRQGGLEPFLTLSEAVELRLRRLAEASR